MIRKLFNPSFAASSELKASELEAVKEFKTVMNLIELRQCQEKLDSAFKRDRRHRNNNLTPNDDFFVKTLAIQSLLFASSQAVLGQENLSKDTKKGAILSLGLLSWGSYFYYFYNKLNIGSFNLKNLSFNKFI